jgi:hypothetical protein
VHPFIRVLGLHHIKNSWFFFISSLYLLTSLGLVILRRSSILNKKNTGFLLNHAGMWILLASAGLGSGDIKRLTMELHEQDEFSNIAADRSRADYKLPFSIKLIDFHIDEYAPKIAIIDRSTGELVSHEGYNHIAAADESVTEFANWTIIIDRFIENAIADSGHYKLSYTEGAAPAAFVRIQNNMNYIITEDWLSCGSYLVPARYIQFDDQYIMVMLSPEPERYRSDIVVHSGRDHDTISIEVNKPFTYKGYTIYQFSFDDQMGRWSEISVLELVRDPWLTIVYTGIFMLLAGAAYIFWIGNEQTKKLK